jgi:E3 ubiquitin-protein ligase DOA10
MRYIGELERKVQTLQTEATTLSAQLALLQVHTFTVQFVPVGKQIILDGIKENSIYVLNQCVGFCSI